MRGHRRAPSRLRAYSSAIPEELRELRRAVEQLSLHLNPPRRADVPTVAEFEGVFLCECAQADRQKPSSVEGKRSHMEHHILPLLGGVRLDDIDGEHVSKLKASCSGLKAKTVNNILATLSKLLKVAVRLRVISKMPLRVEGVKTDLGSAAFYEYEDYEILMTAARGLGPREYATVVMGGDAGLRAGEMRALLWPAVDLRRGLLTVERSTWRGVTTSTKGRKVRRVPMTPTLALALVDLPRKGDHVFLNDEDEPISEQNQRTWMKNAQLGAGLRANGGLHVLRHTFCSHLAMRGAPVVTIKELAGHASLRTTMRYMHLVPSEASRAIALLEEGRKSKSNPKQKEHDMLSRHAAPKASHTQVSPAGFEKTLLSPEVKLPHPEKLDALGATEPFGQNFTFGKPGHVAKLLGVSVRTVYRLISEGPLVARRFGKRSLRIHRDDLKAFLSLALAR